MQNLLLPSTIVVLNRSKLPQNTAWTDVPDSLLSTEQKELLATAKQVFGVDEASSFCVGVKPTGGRTIVQPKLVQQVGTVGIRWGSKTYSLPENTKKFDDVLVVENKVYVLLLGYIFPVGFIDPTRMDEKNVSPVQKMFRAADDVNKRAALVKRLSFSELSSLLQVAGYTYVRLRDLPEGEYTVVSYDMEANGKFGTKYLLELADGRKLSSNTQIKRICSEWDSMGVEVSEDHPARLVVGKSSETSTGNIMVHTELYSASDLALEPFDFSVAGSEELIPF